MDLSSRQQWNIDISRFNLCLWRKSAVLTDCVDDHTGLAFSKEH